MPVTVIVRNNGLGRVHPRVERMTFDDSPDSRECALQLRKQATEQGTFVAWIENDPKEIHCAQ